jgi:hypothetical protein
MNLSNGLPVENRAKFTVKIDPTGEAFRKAAKWEHAEMVRITRFQPTTLVPEEADVVRYCRTLTWLRVQIANDNRAGIKKYNYRGLYIPSRMYTIVHHIGVALNSQFNIKLVPSYEIDCDDLMGPEEMQTISDNLELLKQEGYSCVKGLQVTEVGVFETMLSWCFEINNMKKILSYKADHPMHAMIAGILGITPVEKGYADVALLVRADYGTVEYLEDNMLSIYKDNITVEKQGSNSAKTESSEA